MSKPPASAKGPPAGPELVRYSPPAVMIDRFVVSVTEAVVFISFDGVSVASPAGGLTPMPAFCGMLSPANAQALLDSLGEALRARLTLTAPQDQPQ